MGGQDDLATDLPATAVGPRLREVREASGISLRQFAKRVGISSSALSQIETGKSAPSVNTLYAIVTELGLSLDQLFDRPGGSRSAPDPGVQAEANGRHDHTDAGGAEEPREAARPGGGPDEDPAWNVNDFPGESGSPQGGSQEARPSSGEWPVQRREARAILNLDTGVTWERLTAEDDPGVDFLVSIYHPGGASAPEGALVRHGGHEYHVVVRGELTVTLGFKTFSLRPGDSISFDSYEPHMLANRGDEPTEVISTVVDRRPDASQGARG